MNLKSLNFWFNFIKNVSKWQFLAMTVLIFVSMFWILAIFSAALAERSNNFLKRGWVFFLLQHFRKQVQIFAKLFNTVIWSFFQTTHVDCRLFHSTGPHLDLRPPIVFFSFWFGYCSVKDGKYSYSKKNQAGLIGRKNNAIVMKGRVNFVKNWLHGLKRMNKLVLYFIKNIFTVRNVLAKMIF